MGKAAEYVQSLNETITKAIKRASAFRARAHAVVDGKVQIQQYESATPMDEFYARLAGPRINPNDEVAVAMLGEHPLVLGKIQRTGESELTFDDDIWIVTDDDRAFRVANAANTTLFAVNTMGIPNAGVYNGAQIQGYAGVAGTPTFNLDSSNGSARFDGAVTINGTTLNSVTLTPPDYRTYSQVNADVANTTNTTTMQPAMARDFWLTPGTYDVWLMGGSQLRHSAGGTAAMRVYAYSLSNGYSYGPTDVQTHYSGSYGPSTSNHLVSNIVVPNFGTTNFLIGLGYRSSAAGTTTCRNPWLMMYAIRKA